MSEIASIQVSARSHFFGKSAIALFLDLIPSAFSSSGREKQA
ncbi:MULTISPECIES: hypothetical protein [Leptolyngbya]|nr:MULTISPECIES: hypothetical protein [Leptolyngbya]